MTQTAIADWTAAEVTIHCDPATGKEWRGLQGWIHPDAPGLAVTPYQGTGAFGDEWVITHVRSGFCVADGDTLAGAQARALALAQLAGGFDVDQAEIKARPRAWGVAAKLIRAADPDILTEISVREAKE